MLDPACLKGKHVRLTLANRIFSEVLENSWYNSYAVAEWLRLVIHCSLFDRVLNNLVIKLGFDSS